MPGANPAYTSTFQFLVEVEKVNLEKKINGLTEFSKKKKSISAMIGKM